MSTSFSQAVEALTAQAQSLIAMANGELEALREELEQERRFRRHLQATAAARTQEWASLQEAERLEREGLEAELAEALEGRRRAEAEVERFHTAVRERAGLLQQLDDAQRARQGVERRLAGVRLAVLDLLAPLGTEEEADEPGGAPPRSPSRPSAERPQGQGGAGTALLRQRLASQPRSSSMASLRSR